MTIRRTSGCSPYEAAFGFSRGVRVGQRILVSGTAPVEPDGSSSPGDAAAQARVARAGISHAEQASPAPSSTTSVSLPNPLEPAAKAEPSDAAASPPPGAGAGHLAGIPEHDRPRGDGLNMANFRS